MTATIKNRAFDAEWSGRLAHTARSSVEKLSSHNERACFGLTLKNMYRRSRRGWLVICLLEPRHRPNTCLEEKMWYRHCGWRLFQWTMAHYDSTIHDPQLFSLRWRMVVWRFCMPRTTLHPLFCSPKMLTRFDELNFSLRIITGRKKQYAYAANKIRCQRNLWRNHHFILAHINNTRMPHYRWVWLQSIDCETKTRKNLFNDNRK